MVWEMMAVQKVIWSIFDLYTTKALGIQTVSKIVSKKYVLIKMTET